MLLKIADTDSPLKFVVSTPGCIPWHLSLGSLSQNHDRRPNKLKKKYVHCHDGVTMKYKERPNTAVLLMVISLVYSTELRGGIPQVGSPQGGTLPLPKGELKRR